MGRTYRWATVELLPAMTAVWADLLPLKKLVVVCAEAQC